MYCEKDPPKPEKPICRCKNCVLRPPDTVPWTNIFAVSGMAERDNPNRLDLMALNNADQEDHRKRRDMTVSMAEQDQRRESNKTRQSMDSVFTISDGLDSRNRSEQTFSQSPGQAQANTPSPALTPTPQAHPHRTQAPSSPTILLIVVNKPEPAPFPVSGPGYPGAGPGYPGAGPRYRGAEPGYPGAGPGYPGAGPGYPGAGPGYPGAGPGYPGAGPGYPGAGPGYPGAGLGYPGAGPGYPGTSSGYQCSRPYCSARRPGNPRQAPKRYPGPGPRRFPGPGGAQNGYYYKPSGPGTGPRQGPGSDHYVLNNRYGYQNEWRGQPRGYPHLPSSQRNCQCTEDSAPIANLNESSDSSINEKRLAGSGNNGRSKCTIDEHDPSERPCCGQCKRSESSDIFINEDSKHNHSERTRLDDIQKVVVTDDKNKTFRCIQVPICISIGRPETCTACKSASALDRDSQSKRISEADNHEKCICNVPDTRNCVSDMTTGPEEFECECNLSNLEQTLRDLNPNADCMCYLEKKRKRKRRKKWCPKVVYDRFANPPFVLNPKPRCLEYGCSPFCNHFCKPCRCGPVGKSCYNLDYCCGRRRCGCC